MPQRTRGIRADGMRSRAAILQAAARLASVTGLEGLTIGALAEVVGMSKGGLHAHFGSKEALQLAAIEAAHDIFVREVVLPALRTEEPVARLRGLADGFLRYVENRVFPGGCFFVAVAAEFGSRPGPVHDAIAASRQQWSDLLRGVADQAIQSGRLPASTDPVQLAFHLMALLSGADLTFVLHDDPALLERARAAVDGLLQATEQAGSA